MGYKDKTDSEENKDENIKNINNLNKHEFDNNLLKSSILDELLNESTNKSTI